MNTTFIDIDSDLGGSQIEDEANVITMPRGPRRKRNVFKQNEPFQNAFVQSYQSLMEFTSSSEELDEEYGNPVVAGNGGSFGRWKMIMQTRTEKDPEPLKRGDDAPDRDSARHNIVYSNDQIDLHWRLMLCHEDNQR